MAFFGSLFKLFPTFAILCQFCQLLATFVKFPNFWHLLATVDNYYHDTIPYTILSIIMVSCYIVILPSCHPVILSICKIFNLSSCHLVSLADIQFVRLSICQPVGFSACKLVSFSACTSWSFRACLPQQSTAQSYLDKAKNAKMAKNYLIGISIEIILGFGENGVQSAVASFCLLFVHFYKSIRPLASFLGDFFLHILTDFFGVCLVLPEVWMTL